MSGANRQICHTGAFAVNHSSQVGARAKTKFALQSATGSEFAFCHMNAFTPLQDIHEHMLTGNVSDIIPLQRGHFIVVLHPHTKNKTPEILLGEVEAIYTNSGACGSKHEWIESVNKVGVPSYVMVRVFHPSHGMAYSSLAFHPLQASAFIRIPASHILFLFATLSSSFSRISLASDHAHPFQLVTLCPTAAMVMDKLCDKVVLVLTCVRDLQAY
ncbi:hypothetical protein SCLCIDRAFT_106465 [Scleroderma citrinum Foug A]|uniref:Uncharacterized protein n=1 Tax=Scleroderma citrinum Foug A TaxID=1036808 RepID=A0A0C3EIY7_9AGAM|nr:hypothetical protein SCLCIDRAFT_106465 [Scleroderma citrinum Foug A]